MNSLEKVESFIARKKSEVSERQDIAQLLPGTMPFVTISSQTGAGGNRLSEILLSKISKSSVDSDMLRDWRIFDREMCQQLLEEEHLAESMEELLDDKYHSQINEFVMGIFGDRGMQNVAYARLGRQLRTLASVGKVIILGHGGCLATRNLAGGLHVRLVAPIATRTAHVASVMSVDEAEAKRMIRKRDKVQRKLLKTHYHTDVRNPKHYHLVCNTEWIPPNAVAEMVVSLLHKQLD